MRIAHIEVKDSHFLSLSFATSAFSGVAKLAMALLTQSFLVLVSGLYALVLCVPRVATLVGTGTGRFLRSGDEGHLTSADLDARESAAPQTRRPQEVSAVFLVVLGVLFVTMSNHTLVNGETTLNLSTIPAITFATCAFVKIGVAVYGVVKERSNSNSVVFANKLTSLADGMASIVLPQIALRGSQGEGADIFDAAFGIVVGIAIVIMGIWLFVRVSHSRLACDTHE